MREETFDYIVVDAGTAGVLLANRLFCDGSKRVTLLEAGKKDNYPWIHIPVGYLYCFGNPRTDWLCNTVADPGLNGQSLRYPRGKTLVGSSSINGMIYISGQARDYDAWKSSTGDESWSRNNLVPIFKAHEDHYRLDDGADPKTGGNSCFSDLHGHDGEWWIEKQRPRWLEAFADAAVEAGAPRTDDFNSGDNEGVGYVEVNQRSGWRRKASKAFLRPVKNCKNLVVCTEVDVERLRFSKMQDGRLRCDGVVLDSPTGKAEYTARCEVILSAGAIGSPQILRLSGVGPASFLQEHGVSVQKDLPGVGENLQDHLQIRTIYKLKGAKTLNTLANNIFGKATIGLEHPFRRTGPMSMSPSQLGAFTKSDGAQHHANLEYHLQPLSLDAFGEPLHTFPALTASVCNLNPKSRERMRIRTSHFADAPLIAPSYLSTPKDQKVAVHSLRQVRRIASQPALAKYEPIEWKPGPQFQSDAELIKLADDIANTIFHPAGTAKMGSTADPTAVFDSRLRVIGVDGLRVVDASVMATIVSGNTNYPTLMIAEKATRMILEDAGNSTAP